MADGRWLSWAYHVGEEGFPFFSRHRGPDQPPEDNERTERGQEMGRLGQLSSVGELGLWLGPVLAGGVLWGTPLWPPLIPDPMLLSILGLL